MARRDKPQRAPVAAKHARQRGGAKPQPARFADDLARLEAWFATQGVRHVKLGGVDVDGVFRGKYVSLEKFWSAAKGGLGFCDVVFGWDLGDVLYDNARVTGWHTGYPDTHARVDLSTARLIPWEPDTAAFLLDFVNADGTPFEASPRQLLQKVRARARSLGFAPKFRRVRVLHLPRDPADRPRQGLPRSRAPHAGHVRLLVAPHLRQRGAGARDRRRLQRIRHPGGGHAHRDRAGRVRDRDPLRRPGPRGRQGRALQDRGEGDLRAAGPSGVLHGQAERRPARLLGPRVPVPLGPRRHAQRLLRRARPARDEQDAAALHRRPVGTHAGADRALLAHRQQLQAQRGEHLGADDGDVSS